MLFITAVLLALLGMQATAATTEGNWTDEGNYSPSYGSQSGNTIHITSEKELARLAYESQSKDFMDMTIVLDRDLNMSGHYWTPISANYDWPFKGTFNGQGHTISGIKVNRSGSSYNGLFGVVGYLNGQTPIGKVLNVTLTDGSIVGGTYSGSVVGWLRYGATVENCFANLSVQGSTDVGGLVGKAEGVQSPVIPAKISGCLYMGSSVSGSSRVGAVVGHCENTVNNTSYYTNLAVSSLNTKEVYALPIVDDTGDDITLTINAGKVTFSGTDYYGTTGTITLQAADPYDNITSVSFNNEQVATQGNDIPLAKAKELGLTECTVTATKERLLSGSGTENDPFKLNNATDWNHFADLVATGTTFSGKYVRLRQNVEGIEKPVGQSEERSFQGTFDGNGFRLSGSISSTAGYDALFSHAKNAVIRNMTVEGTYTVGKHGAALVGRAYGTLTLQDICFSGTLQGNSDLCGGLVGCADDATLLMTNCTYKGTFTGSAKFHPIAVRSTGKTVHATLDRVYFYQGRQNGISNQNIGVKAIQVTSSAPTDGSYTETTDAAGATCYHYTAPQGLSIDYDAERTAADYYYIDMTTDGTEKVATLDGTATTFTIYDDGGMLHDSDTGHSRLTLIAPAGKKFSVSGQVIIDINGKCTFSLSDESGSLYQCSDNMEWSGYNDEQVCTISGVTTIDNRLIVEFSNNGALKNIVLTATLQDNTATTYPVTIGDDGDGTLTTDKQKCVAGGMVTITAVPNDGYYIYDVLVVKKQTGGALDVTRVDDQHYTFIMPSDDEKGVIVRAIFNKPSLKGNGEEDTPYIIASTDNWNSLATFVSKGIDLHGKHVRLEQDISDVSTPVGTSETPFTGTFHGGSHTITADINGSAGCEALFAYIVDATIENLHVSGTATVGQHGAALVGKAGGTSVIKNVVVDATVAIHPDVEKTKQHHGAVVGHAQASNTTLRGVVFSGTMKGINDVKENMAVGGLIGWSDAATLTLQDCLFCGTYEGAACFHPIAVKTRDAEVSATANNVFYTEEPTPNLGKNISIEGRWAMSSETKPEGWGSVATDYGFLQAYEKGLCYGGKYYSTYTLTLADDADNTQVIADHKGKTVDVVLSGRTLHGNNTWNTLCLPFSLTTLTGTPLEGAEVRQLDDAEYDKENGTLTFNFYDPDTDYEYACFPCIVRWPEGTEDKVNPVFRSVTIASDNASKEYTDVDFIGTFAPVTLKGGDRSVLYLGAGNTLYWPEKDVTVGPFRAYFQLDGITAGDLANGVRQFVLNFGDGKQTGIISAEANSSLFTLRSSLQDWFTIDGRPLSGKPTQRGVYINKGKKIMVK